MKNKVLEALYKSDFKKARLIIYATIIGVMAISFFAPIHYACSEMGAACLGCGFKTAISCALDGNFLAAVTRNQLFIPALLFGMTMVCDISTMLLMKTPYRTASILRRRFRNWLRKVRQQR